MKTSGWSLSAVLVVTVACLALSASAAAVPDQPRITDTDPDSPSSNSAPLVKGVLGPGGAGFTDPETIEIWRGDPLPFPCTVGPGGVVATGSPAQFTGPGISAPAIPDRRNFFCARAIDGVGGPSAMHTGGTFEYDHVTYPPPPGELGVSINNGARFTNDSDVTLYPVWPRFAHTMVVSNDGGFAHPGTLTVDTQRPWTLDSSGPERLPKTIYVRFRFSNGQATHNCGQSCTASSTETHTDDIILDQTPPQVQSATTGGGGNSASAAISNGLVAKTGKGGSRRIRIRARDQLSGVAQLQVTDSKKRPGELRPFKPRIKFKGGGSQIFVRVWDAAGNPSKWRQVEQRRRRR